MPRESTIVRRIMDAVKKRYPRAVVTKTADRFTRGILDLTIQVMCRMPQDVKFGMGADIFFGGTLYVETKVPRSGRLSKIQEETIRRLNAAGGDTLVATSVEQVMAKLEEMGAIHG
jgi:hypothetical protein